MLVFQMRVFQIIASSGSLKRRPHPLDEAITSCAPTPPPLALPLRRARARSAAPRPPALAALRPAAPVLAALRSADTLCFPLPAGCGKLCTIMAKGTFDTTTTISVEKSIKKKTTTGNLARHGVSYVCADCTNGGALVDAEEYPLDRKEKNRLRKQWRAVEGFGDLSSVGGPGLSAGSPTLDGSANATELERMRGSIERLTAQVNSGREALATVSGGLKGASPDERVQLLRTLQDDPELQKLVRVGLMSWDDLMRPNPAKGSEGHVAGVDADTPVIDDKKLAALQSKRGTAAQKQANDLTRVLQVVERRRTTAGAVPAAAGAFYPGLKVWTPAAFAPPIPPGRR